MAELPQQTGKDPDSEEATTRESPEEGFASLVREFSTAYGITEVEAAHRLRLQPEVGQLAERLRKHPRFAGIWIDQENGGAVVVAFTEARSQDLQEATKGFSAPDRLRLVDHSRTLNELNGIQDRLNQVIPALIAGGAEIRTWGIDEGRNQILVRATRDGIMELSAAANEGIPVDALRFNEVEAVAVGKASHIRRVEDRMAVIVTTN